jgi:hypothetical protein
MRLAVGLAHLLHPCLGLVDSSPHLTAETVHQPGLVLCLLLGREAVIEGLVVHVRFSFECGERRIECLHEPAISPDLAHQALAMGAKGHFAVELRRAQHPTDVVQRKAELAVEQDLLQPQQLLATVIAVAIRANAGRLEEADLVIVVECPDRDSGQFRYLLDRIVTNDVSPWLTRAY